MVIGKPFGVVRDAGSSVVAAINGVVDDDYNSETDVPGRCSCCSFPENRAGLELCCLDSSTGSEDHNNLGPFT